MLPADPNLAQPTAPLAEPAQAQVPSSDSALFADSSSENVTETAPQNYRALARRYRPLTLTEMVGQDVTVTILRRALEEKRLHHALLFTGMRGVGKTTLARIIARTLNCPESDIAPCNQCPTCLAILRDSHLDVIEIDAASNSGVDNIRDIIDVSRYCPTQAQNIVFIIDEVHMLSRSAFNAMLKTLEEPPAHVYFLLATTEPNKIPPTVLSRCLRLALKRVDIRTMTDFLQSVCVKETVSAEPEALRELARNAQGSIRDALSILDQLILSSDAKITIESVETALGATDRSSAYWILQACLEGNSAEAIRLAEQRFDYGNLPQSLLERLIESVWWVIRYKGGKEFVTQDSLSELEMQRVTALAPSVSIATLSAYWRLLHDLHGRLQSAYFPDRAFIVGLIELTRISELPSPYEIIKQWEAKPQGLSTAPAANAEPLPEPDAQNTASQNPDSLTPELQNSDSLTRDPPLNAQTLQSLYPGAEVVPQPKSSKP